MPAPAKPRAASAISGGVGKKPAIMPEHAGAQLGAIADKRQQMVHCVRRQPPPSQPAVNLGLRKRQ